MAAGSATDPHLADLVFEGGGVKGIGLAGAYRELSDRGYEPGCVAGTSAGAIMASLVAAGYSGAELQDIVLDKQKMDFTKFEDGGFLDRFGAVGDIAEFFRTRGMHSGDYFLGWIRDLLRAKGKTTFGDLRDPNATDPERAYKLRVIASDLSTRSMLVLPGDARELGTEPDELEIAEAVRMSMSIPVFFRPATMGGHEIVDGGLLSNFPIWLFDTPPDRPPSFPTFGLLLVAPGQTAPLVATGGTAAPVEPIGSDIDFLKAIVGTMMEAHDRFYVEQANYARTIPIPTLGVRTTEFDITASRAEALFNSGREAARTFLATWDFEAYVAKFRSGATVSRRASVLGSPAATAVPQSP
ncbi:MAG TPA: patatin-like phospholipase family protein [Solirubrobacteraceae bacterium]